MTLRRVRLLAVLWIGGILAQPVLALGTPADSPRAAPADSSLQEQVRTLDQKVRVLERLRELDQEAAAAKAKADPPPVVKPAGKEPKLTVGGLVQAQGEFGDAGDSRFAKNDRFLLRRARINAQGGFLEGFDFRVELDLGGSSAGLRAQLTDGYAAWTGSKIVSIRFGQFKTPFGYEQLFSDPALLIIERSLANDRLTLSRQLGLQISATSLDRRLSAAAGVFNGNGVNNGLNDNEKFLFVGRVTAVPVQAKRSDQEVRWSLGAGAYTTQDSSLTLNDFGFRGNAFSGKRSGLGLDTQVRFGLFDLWAEYLRAQFKPVDSIPSAKLISEGGYVQGSYFLVPKKFQGVVRYELFDPNRDLGGNSTKTWLLGLNYFFKGDDLKLQLDYQRSNASGLSSRENKLFTRLQVVF